MRMKFVKNTGNQSRKLELPDGSSFILGAGSTVENVDVKEVPGDCDSSVELSEIKRMPGKKLLHG